MSRRPTADAAPPENLARALDRGGGGYGGGGGSNYRELCGSSGEFGELTSCNPSNLTLISKCLEPLKTQLEFSNVVF